MDSVIVSVRIGNSIAQDYEIPLTMTAGQLMKIVLLENGYKGEESTGLKNINLKSIVGPEKVLGEAGLKTGAELEIVI